MKVNWRKGAGYLTLTARDAEEALHELEGAVEVQIRLTDIKMPGTMDGFALAELIQRRWPGIKILFVSGRFNRGDEEAYSDAVFLSKPFTHRQLTGALLNVV